jgi:hypothetical protein
MLIGHSFGGKVVMSMARQFASGAGTALPRPVQVWVLDAPPGEARAGGGAGGGDDVDHPARLIEALARVPMPVAGRGELVEHLTRQGFSAAIATWWAGRPGSRRLGLGDRPCQCRMHAGSRHLVVRGFVLGDVHWGAPLPGPSSPPFSPPCLQPPRFKPARVLLHPRRMTTNLRPSESGGLKWAFDLEGIAQMYASYEATALWDLLRAPPQGLRVDFVKAARSAFGWDGEGAIGALGHGVHLLDAGHWVHTDNPGEGQGCGPGPGARGARRVRAGCGSGEALRRAPARWADRGSVLTLCQPTWPLLLVVFLAHAGVYL